MSEPVCRVEGHECTSAADHIRRDKSEALDLLKILGDLIDEISAGRPDWGTAGSLGHILVGLRELTGLEE